MGRISANNSNNNSFMSSISAGNFVSENLGLSQASLDDAQSIVIDESVQIVFKTPDKTKKAAGGHAKYQLQAARSEIELLRLKLELKDQEIAKLNDKLDQESLKVSDKKIELSLSTQGYSKSINILKNENDILNQESKFIKQLLEKLTQNAADKDQRIETLMREAEEKTRDYRSKMKSLQFKLNFARNQIKTYEEFKTPYALRERDIKIDTHINCTEEMQTYTKASLVRGFTTEKTLMDVSEFLIEQLESREGGNWLCYIRPEKSVPGLKYQYTEKCLKMSFFKDQTRFVIDVAQTRQAL